MEDGKAEGVCVRVPEAHTNIKEQMKTNNAL